MTVREVFVRAAAPRCRLDCTAQVVMKFDNLRRQSCLARGRGSEREVSRALFFNADKQHSLPALAANSLHTCDQHTRNFFQPLFKRAFRWWNRIACAHSEY